MKEISLSTLMSQLFYSSTCQTPSIQKFPKYLFFFLQFFYYQQFKLMELNTQICHFQTLNLLGQGTYAQVYLVRHRCSQQLMAAKVMKKSFISRKKAAPQILNEKNILSELDHPFVMKLNLSFQSRFSLFLMMEYCPGGQLFRLLEKRGKLNQNQACFYGVQIALAVQYLHEKNIVYRDLKPENVVIDQKGFVKITDFGLAGYLPVTDTKLLGTPQYFAPEVVSQQESGKEVDWWCFGLILYEMVLGEAAFQASNRTNLMQKIVTQEPHFPKTMSNKLKSLIQLLLKKNPKQRLGAGGASEILEHPWFEKIDIEQVLKKEITPPFIPTLKSKLDVSNFDSKFTTAMIEPLEEEIEDSETEDETEEKGEKEEDLFKGYECIKMELVSKKVKGKSKVIEK